MIKQIIPGSKMFCASIQITNASKTGVQVFNPASSGVIIYINAINMISLLQTKVSFRKHNAELASLTAVIVSDIIDYNGSTPAATTGVSSSPTVGTVIQSLYSGQDNSEFYNFPLGFRLDEGEGFHIEKDETSNKFNGFSIYWEEV